MTHEIVKEPNPEVELRAAEAKLTEALAEERRTPANRNAEKMVVTHITFEAIALMRRLGDALEGEYRGTEDREERTRFGLGKASIDIDQPLRDQLDQEQLAEVINASRSGREPKKVEIPSPWRNGYRVVLYPFATRVNIVPQGARSRRIDTEGLWGISTTGGANVQTLQYDGSWRDAQTVDAARSALGLVEAMTKMPSVRR